MRNPIAERFGRSLGSYDSAAVVQQFVACRMLSLMTDIDVTLRSRHDAIFEFGCGTGFFTSGLVDALQPETLYVNDVSDAMLASTCQRLAAVQSDRVFTVVSIHDDAEASVWPVDLDLVASASVTQWFQNPLASISKAHASLRTGGQFWVGTYGPETFRELRGGAPDNDHYPLLTQWTESLEQSGFRILAASREFYHQHFDTRTDMLRMMAMTGIGTRRDSSASAVGSDLTWDVIIVGAEKIS